MSDIVNRDVDMVEVMGDGANEVHYFRGNARESEWDYAARCAKRGDQPNVDSFEPFVEGRGWVSMSAGGGRSVLPVENEATDGEKLGRMESLLNWQKLRVTEIPEGEISQFWLQPYWDGNHYIDQRYAMCAENDKDGLKRPRLWGDLAWMVHRDKGRQFRAGMHIMKNLGVPPNSLNGVHDLVETAFLNMGFRHLLHLQEIVAFRCLMVQFAKKYEMMEERANEFYERRKSWVTARYGMGFVPMYPHPNHPSKGAGHEAHSIGAAIVPLWYYDQDFEIPLMWVDEIGRLYDTGKTTCVGDEWRKMWVDHKRGRQIAGVHWLEDSIGVVKPMERFGVDVLRSLVDTDMVGRYTFKGLSGEALKV